jgi:penicillin-binding protein-related factor A (putative recombinase)
MSVKRIMAGKKAKIAGDNFESLFENQCLVQSISVVAIPNSCKRVSRFKLIQIKSPFDFVLCYKKRAAFIDTKSTKQKTFSHSMIDQHQVRELSKLSPGGVSGYIIALLDKVYFVDVSILKETKPGSSVDFTRALYLGTRLGFDCRLIF